MDNNKKRNNLDEDIDTNEDEESSSKKTKKTTFLKRANSPTSSPTALPYDVATVTKKSRTTSSPTTNAVSLL